VPLRVEAVRVCEVRVGEPELSGLRVHQADEAWDRAVADVCRERVRRVVGALDQRGAEQVGDGEPLAWGECDRRLTDGGCPLRDRDDLVELGLLERHEGGHQLRDRRDRQLLAVVEGREHLARRGVLDEVRLGVHERRCGSAADRERQGERSCEHDWEERDDPQGLQTAATLLDANPLPDSQGDRIEPGIQRQQALDRRVELGRDRLERVAGLDRIVPA
jgi:hypothetical protein